MADPIPLAATVVLLRDGPEVFLMKRHGSSAFLGGAHVFPGGKVDATDRAPAWRALLPDADLTTFLRREGGPDAEGARALLAASLRETFEEAGVLLGEPVPPEAAVAQRQLNSGALRFPDWVEHARPRLRARDLVFFDHWITPEVEPRRFDTWFFAARVPADQTPTSLSRETTEGVWMRPAEAIARFHRGEIELAPPTSTTLVRLSAYATPEAALQGLGRRPICTMLPRFLDQGGETLLILPGHPLYGPHQGTLDPGGPTLVRLQEGRWLPEMAPVAR